MAHVLTQIRDAVVAKLKANVTLVSGRVTTRRLHLVQRLGETPFILVNTDGGPAERTNQNRPAQYTRNAGLTIEIIEKGREEGEDNLDAIQAQVEKALADTLLGGLVNRLNLTADPRDVDMLEKPVSIARLQYEATYTVAAIDPETPIA